MFKLDKSPTLFVKGFWRTTLRYLSVLKNNRRAVFAVTQPVKRKTSTGSFGE
jgi:hypothetical protein